MPMRESDRRSGLDIDLHRRRERRRLLASHWNTPPAVPRAPHVTNDPAPKTLARDQRGSQGPAIVVSAPSEYRVNEASSGEHDRGSGLDVGWLSHPRVQ